jgi:hypothetical protein
MLLLGGDALSAAEPDRWADAVAGRKAYRAVLEKVRKTHGGSYHLPAVEFFLFGMGSRDKFIYADGKLRNALTGKLVREWEVEEQVIAPAEYMVVVRTKGEKTVAVIEDEEGVWVEADGKREALSKGAVKMPDFRKHPYAPALRVLHQELLVNVIGGKPVPNFLVYDRPWYRDAAMMAMAFARTGNLPLVKDWILNLDEPYDKNNRGETEPDNLGQALYLVSLVSDKSHPLVPKVRKEFARFEKANGAYIEGRTDFAPHPVYQTKWAKFGLRSLGLDDPYTVPQVRDSYATLFWWAYKDADLKGQAVPADDRYPYLVWAGSHYAGKTAGKLSDRDYPLTWEADASYAKYDGMKAVGPEYVKVRTCAPRAWHAAEAFLYLLDQLE